MKLAQRIELRQLCRLGQVSRAGFYRWRKRPAKPADRDLEVRDAIQRIALKFPYSGSFVSSWSAGATRSIASGCSG